MVHKKTASVTPMTDEYKDRLVKAMKAAGVDAGQLADALRLSYQAIKKVIDGKSKSFTAENNAKAASFLGANPDWLATGKGPMESVESEYLSGMQRKYGMKSAPSNVPAPVPMRPGEAGSPDDIAIPQYDAGGAMGHGLVLEERQPGIIKSWHVDHEWLRLNVRHHTGVQNLCIVTGFGPSMQPKYNPGDPLLLDRGVKAVETDGIYFFRVGKHGFIKQLQRIPTEGGLLIRAKSLNKDYDPFDITERMDFEVFGKVLTVWRSEHV